jgi:very-short-patch-repair endonuclease
LNVVPYHLNVQSRAKLVVEVDGSQHSGGEAVLRDAQRDGYLASQGLHVLRFTNRQVLWELDSVLEMIRKVLAERLAGDSP